MRPRDAKRRSTKEWASKEKAWRSSPAYKARKKERDSKPEVRNEKRAKQNAKESKLLRSQRDKKRRQSDIHFAIRERLRRRIQHAVKSGTKSETTLALIGCNESFLRGYIEARFLADMTWANRDLWHIDHRIPCAAFDLSKPEEQRRCFHYSNLQPLWKAQNLAKGRKLNFL